MSTLLVDSSITLDGSTGSINIKGWTLSVPDYVFERDYRFADLPALKAHIAEHHRLPDMPSAAQIAEEGLEVGEFCMLLLKKIEELSLYILQQDERLARLERPSAE